MYLVVYKATKLIASKSCVDKLSCKTLSRFKEFLASLGVFGLNINKEEINKIKDND
jgi:hypothetical protein